ncbi:MAG: selenide, water dikinase SelD [Mesorhizobium sp.]|nr:MAG: selenide, water dikinase SelD [Mesorhizobium sp.]RWA86887.1 MAG: selenide, water dikinase SelD [Mesorhizobium sp.]
MPIGASRTKGYARHFEPNWRNVKHLERRSKSANDSAQENAIDAFRNVVLQYRVVLETAPASRGDITEARLTSLAHGGGCGCKLAPSVLQQLLAEQAEPSPFRQLLVGTETGDDAAVWQIDDATCVIATTDFFMPMVDDPYDFGRIAAANALSDVYAMGGRPIMALAIVGMPIGKLPTHTVREILKGGRDICATAGIPVAGGHSIDSPEPIYGLAVTGICRPADIRRNSGARPGDALILTKGLGVGIYSAAIKKQALSLSGYQEMIASTTLLNRIGAELAKDASVHAITDVTGFGLLGHALEMARGSACELVIRDRDIPVFAQASSLAKQGFVTGASQRNWASYGDAVRLHEGMPEWRRDLLTDPQTSGGLLVACEPGSASALVETIVACGYPSARLIGCVKRGRPAVAVEE